MPRYFFDLRDGGTARDDIGTEFVGLGEIRRAAMSLLADVARDEIARGRRDVTLSVLVRDEAGCSVFSGTLSCTEAWLTGEP